MAREESSEPENIPADASLSGPARRAPGTARPAMQDVTMLLFTVVFFALAFLYVMACQKLR
jgi:hypothetical protein